MILEKQLVDKVVVITGGSSGIGFESARLLADHGASVIITGRTQRTLDEAKSQLPVSVVAIQSDTSNLRDIEDLMREVGQRFGRIDVVFANAGIAKPCPTLNASVEHYDDHFNINVKGLYFTIAKAIPLMTEGGSIILNGSIVKEKGFPDFSVYSATKAAVRCLARAWAVEFGPKKIRVNCLSPGPTDTPIFKKMGMSDAEEQEFLESTSSPLGRMGRPEDLAKAVLFFASDASSFVTGSDLIVDGGVIQL